MIAAPRSGPSVRRTVLLGALPSRVVAPSRREDVIGFSLIIALVTVYFTVFGRMILTEDTGFYGFLARSILGGAVLHRDIPVATNSVGIYLTALLFRVTGPSVTALRLFHLVGLAVVLGGLYLLVSRLSGWWSALATTSVAGLFVANPAVMLDLGSNFLYWSIGLLLLGVCVDQTTSREPRLMMLSGSLFGFAALFRETFIVFALVYWLYLGAAAVVASLRGQEWRRPLQRAVLFGVGVLLAVSVNALLLTVNNTWPEYFRAMFVSGREARYAAGIVAPRRLLTNINRWIHYPGHKMMPDALLLLAALVAYVPRSTDRVVRTVKWLLIPAALFEALVINNTFQYHVAPLVTMAALLVGLVLQPNRIADWVHGRAAIPGSAMLQFAMVAASVTGVLMAVASGYVPMAFHSLDVSLGADTATRFGSKVNSEVLSSIADQVPHRRITADAQWQFLLLVRNASPGRPFIEDTTAAFNLHRPDIWRRTMEMINADQVDLLGSKTHRRSYPSPGVVFQGTDWGQLIADKYMYLADLSFDARTDYFSPRRYSDRLMIRRGLVEGYPVVRRPVVELGPQTREAVIPVPSEGSFVVLATPMSNMPDGSYSMRVRRSLVVYRSKYSRTNMVSSFVPAGQVATLSVTKTVERTVEFQVEVRRVR